MNARVDERARGALRQQVGTGGDAAADEQRGDPGAVQHGEAEGGRKVEDEQQAEHPVRALADLEQLLLRRGDSGHSPGHRPDGHFL